MAIGVGGAVHLVHAVQPEMGQGFLAVAAQAVAWSHKDPCVVAGTWELREPHLRERESRGR